MEILHSRSPFYTGTLTLPLSLDWEDTPLISRQRGRRKHFTCLCLCYALSNLRNLLPLNELFLSLSLSLVLSSLDDDGSIGRMPFPLSFHCNDDGIGMMPPDDDGLAPDSENPTFLHYWTRSPLENTISGRPNASCAVCSLATINQSTLFAAKSAIDLLRRDVLSLPYC